MNLLEFDNVVTASILECLELNELPLYFELNKSLTSKWQGYLLRRIEDCYDVTLPSNIGCSLIKLCSLTNEQFHAEILRRWMDNIDKECDKERQAFFKRIVDMCNYEKFIVEGLIQLPNYYVSKWNKKTDCLLVHNEAIIEHFYRTDNLKKLKLFVTVYFLMDEAVILHHCDADAGTNMIEYALTRVCQKATLRRLKVTYVINWLQKSDRIELFNRYFSKVPFLSGVVIGLIKERFAHLIDDEVFLSRLERLEIVTKEAIVACILEEITDIVDFNDDAATRKFCVENPDILTVLLLRKMDNAAQTPK